MMTTETETTADLLRRVNAFNWVHQIDLGNGIVTPGRWPPHPLVLQALERIDFKGKKVLDIGCWDGLWSFEAERRGAAEVYATDDVSQRSYQDESPFLLAHKALSSRVKYFPHLSVESLPEKLGVKDFDVVLFLGVYYHLKNPLLALSKLRSVLKDGGLLLVEGDVINGPKESYARFFYRNWHFNDASNWWVPTVPCLREWVECSYFEIVAEYNDCFTTRQSPLSKAKAWVKWCLGSREVVSRCLITGRACRRADRNYVFPDHDLSDFDLNKYGI